MPGGVSARIGQQLPLGATGSSECRAPPRISTPRAIISGTLPLQPMLATKRTPASGEMGVRIRLVAGVRYEVEQRNFRRNLEIVEVRFKARGGALVPVGA